MTEIDDDLHAWVAVGINIGHAAATWFYAFATADEAEAFTTACAAAEIPIDWTVYPCRVDTPAEAFANVRELL